jgi:hypothetical protein
MERKAYGKLRSLHLYSYWSNSLTFEGEYTCLTLYWFLKSLYTATPRQHLTKKQPSTVQPVPVRHLTQHFLDVKSVMDMKNLLWMENRAAGDCYWAVLWCFPSDSCRCFYCLRLLSLLDFCKVCVFDHGTYLNLFIPTLTTKNEYRRVNPQRIFWKLKNSTLKGARKRNKDTDNFLVI